MKNFEFNRFSKVVVRDFHNTYSLFGLSLLILMLLPLLFWLFALAVQDDVVEVFNRRKFIQLAVFLTAAISSMKIYNSCNLIGKGNYFAMLPASLCEKFTSMLLYSFIVCPLLVFGGSVAVDTLLTAIPYGPYKDYLWQLPEWMTPIFTTNFGKFVLLSIKLFAVASLFMLANTIFKKNKFIKTVLWLALIGFVLILAIAPIMHHYDWLDLQDFFLRIARWFHIDSIESFTHFIYWSEFSFYILLTFLFSFFTYRRLKKMQY